MAAQTAGGTTSQSIQDFLRALNQAPPATQESCPAQDKHCVPKFVLNKDIDDESVTEAIAWADAWEKAGAKALVIELNTNGGDIDSGFRLSKRIEESKVPVHCIVDGSAYSMGMYILQSCSTRAATFRSTAMTHQPSVGGRMYGPQSEYQNIVDMLRAMRNAMARHVMHRMRISFEEYQVRTAGSKQWWFDSVDMLRWGAVDGLVNTVPGYMAQWHLHGKPSL